MRTRGDLLCGRMFVAGIGADLTYECLLTNEPWDDVVTTLGRMNWPTSEKYLSVRQFFVARRAE